jgi:hypothetical protein
LSIKPDPLGDILEHIFWANRKDVNPDDHLHFDPNKFCVVTLAAPELPFRLAPKRNLMDSKTYVEN